MNPELTKTLWDTADKLRSNMDAAEYKHIVLGLIFLKYVSDSFDERLREVQCIVADPSSDYYVGTDPSDQEAALEDRDYYTSANVFWVPATARWEAIRNQAKQPDIGRIIDDALIAIEHENPSLKGILDKRFARSQLEPGKLGELIDLISKIGFGGGEKAKDVLGQVYEYFLGQFASAEGKKGGQFYTPASVVKVLVEVLSPHKGKIYDPCCGSGGMFVQSEKQKRVYCTAPTRYAEAGDTLIIVRAPVGDVNMASERCCIGRGVATARHKTGSRSYTYYFMQALETAFEKFDAEGTVFGSISKKDFHNIKRIMPPEKLVTAFYNNVSTLDDKIGNNSTAILTIASLRDTLLPRLMSGQLRVPEAEQMMEGAA